jgi:hypothetical protein
MKKIAVIIAISVILLCTCFTTSKNTISQNADINQYHYATIRKRIEYSRIPKLKDYSISIKDTLTKTRITVIDETEIQFNDAHKGKVLLVEYSERRNNMETIVDITFTDYYNKQLIATCKGAMGFGVLKSDDLHIAMEKALKQMKELVK